MSLETFDTPQAADARTILRLFLEKLEQLTTEEREVIVKTVHLLNNPLFVSR